LTILILNAPSVRKLKLLKFRIATQQYNLLA
jgi:hypothetical protein